MHKPIKILEVRELDTVSRSVALEQENRVTLEYIERFGLSRVRGGIVTALDDERAIRRVATALSLYG